MRIIIEMPEPNASECPMCSGEHGPKEICEVDGIFLQSDYEASAARAKAIADSANTVRESDNEDY